MTQVVRCPWGNDAAITEYHDTEWGRELRGDRELFERMSLEAFQSGLSWAIVLRKRPGFRTAFAGFDPEAVAAFDEDDVERLLADAAIIRNRAKVLATIGNAQATLALREDGGLPKLVWGFRPAQPLRPTRMAEIPTTSPESVALAKELKRRGFRFVGPTTAFALMEATGIVDTHLVGSHRRGSSGVWPADV